VCLLFWAPASLHIRLPEKNLHTLGTFLEITLNKRKPLPIAVQSLHG
jgi:hypothetical protein